jgi:hypothetical protein
MGSLFWGKTAAASSKCIADLCNCRQLVLHRPRFDLVYLCQYIDILCVSAAASWTYQQHNSFHSIIGPRLRLHQVLSSFSLSAFFLDSAYLVSLCEVVEEIVYAMLDTKPRCLSFTRTHCPLQILMHDCIRDIDSTRLRAPRCRRVSKTSFGQITVSASYCYASKR